MSLTTTTLARRRRKSASPHTIFRAEPARASAPSSTTRCFRTSAEARSRSKSRRCLQTAEGLDQTGAQFQASYSWQDERTQSRNPLQGAILLGKSEAQRLFSCEHSHQEHPEPSAQTGEPNRRVEDHRSSCSDTTHQGHIAKTNEQHGFYPASNMRGSNQAGSCSTCSPPTEDSQASFPFADEHVKYPPFPFTYTSTHYPQRERSTSEYMYEWQDHWDSIGRWGGGTRNALCSRGGLYDRSKADER